MRYRRGAMCLALPSALALTACAYGGPELRQAVSTTLAQWNAAEDADHYAQGKAHLEAGRYGFALSEFLIALHEGGRPVHVLNAIAVTYDALGRRDLARRYFEEARRRDPDSPITAHNLTHFAQGGEAVTANLDELPVAPVRQFPVTAQDVELFASGAEAMIAGPDDPPVPRHVIIAAVQPGLQPYFEVQLGAFGAENRARHAWDVLSQEYPDLLASFVPSIRAADLGAKGVWWRLRVGRFTGQAAAEAFCGRLKSRGVDCFEELSNQNHESGRPHPDGLVSIRIVNGTGRARMALRFARFLRSQGIHVASLANADRFGHRVSTIYYRAGYEEAAEALSRRFAVAPAVKEEAGLAEEIEIVLGDDLVPFDEGLIRG